MGLPVTNILFHPSLSGQWESPAWNMTQYYEEPTNFRTGKVFRDGRCTHATGRGDLVVCGDTQVAAS